MSAPPNTEAAPHQTYNTGYVPASNTAIDNVTN